MASLNKVFLMGNLTREPELRYTPGSNFAVCEFGIAVNRRFTQAGGAEKDETCFVEIVVWGKQAESCSRFLQKGASVFIEGRLVYDQWTEKETQKKRSRLRVTAERVQFMSRRDDAAGMPSGGDTGYDEDPTRQGYTSPRPQYSRAPQAPRQGGYQRQQYNNGGVQQQSAQPMPPQASGNAPVDAEQPPAMPDVNPFEDVDDIPF